MRSEGVSIRSSYAFAGGHLSQSERSTEKLNLSISRNYSWLLYIETDEDGLINDTQLAELTESDNKWI